MPATQHLPGSVYALADDFADALEADQVAAVDQVLAAWGQTYGRVRVELDQVFHKIDAAKAAGKPIKPAWLYQQTRLSSALDTAKEELARYAEHASQVAIDAQASAVKAGLKHAEKLATQALTEASPALAASFVHLNEANLRAVVGFLANGSPLDSLVAALPAQTAEALRLALVRGVTLGKGVDWMRRQVDAAMGMARHRAETIVRTESHRAYRYVARQTYLANEHVLEGWTWHAHLDALCCPACVIMHGTVHAVDETLDGHPRCRCAMVPRTKSWGDLDPALADLPDTRPDIEPGKAWFQRQSPGLQRALLGPGKCAAWKAGTLSLDDLVARTFSSTWGTMRRERSLAEIKAGANGNWGGPSSAPVTAPTTWTPNLATAKALANDQAVSIATLKALLRQTEGQELADIQAALAMRLNRQDFAVVLPEPDAGKVSAALAKLENAAKVKGYPSKGYSQTVAIYKAQAKGAIGSKVGVIKSLDWQTKVNAQAILAQHDEWLKGWVAAKAEADNAMGEWFAKHNLALGDAAHDGEWLGAYEAAAGDIAHLPMLARAKADAWLQGEFNAYADAKDAVLGTWKGQGHEWTPKPGTKATGVLDLDTLQDGWAVIDYADSSQVLSPVQVNKLLASGDWEPNLPEPDPSKVNAVIKNTLTGVDGTLDETGVGWIEDALAETLDADAKAVLTEALAQAKATLLPKPSAGLVESVAQMAEGYTVKELKESIQAYGDLLDGWNPATNTMLQKANYSATKATLQSILDTKTGAKVKPSLPPEVVAEIKATPPPAAHAFPGDPGQLADTGKVLGTHGARVYLGPDGTRWLFKGPKDPGDGFLATLDDAASQIQAKVGLQAPDTYVVTIGGQRGSIQRMYDDATQAFPGGFNPVGLSDPDLLAVQREHVLDWLLANHDGHHEQFLRRADGSLVGIDKGQAFRWFGQDRLDWDFHPNGVYGAPPPVYNRLWADFAAGKDVEAFDPTHGPLADFIRQVQTLDDDEFRALLRPYAEQAAAKGKLAVPQPSFPGVVKATIPANDVEAFLDAVVARKHNLGDDFGALYDRALAQRLKAAPGWTPKRPLPGMTKAKAKGKTKWKDAPAPPKPEPPTPPEAHKAALFSDWLAQAEARYQAAPIPSHKASLKDTANWPRFERVIEQGDRQAVQELLDRHYLDEVMAKEALDLIDQANAAEATVQAAYAKALAAHERALKRWTKDVTAWREANGILTGPGDLGLEGALVFNTSRDGARYLYPRLPKASDYKGTELADLRSYTGSGYTSMNGHLRHGDASEPFVRRMDGAFSRTPALGEDIVVTRNTYLDWAGVPRGADPGSLIGQPLRDKGYMSTGANRDGAMDAPDKVKVHLRVPAGTRGIWVSGDSDGHGVISSVQGEAELLLERGVTFVPHAVYRRTDGRWIMEAEVVPEGWTKPAGWRPNVTPDRFGHRTYGGTSG